MSSESSASGSSGVGNCASSFVQGLSYYRDAHGNEPVPGPDERRARRLSRRRHRDRLPPSTSAPPRSAATSRRRSSPRPTTRSASPAVPQTRRHASSAARPSTGSASTCATRSRNRTSAEADVADDPASARGTDVARLLPAGRLAAGDGMVRRAGARGGLRLRQLHPGLHRLDPEWRRRFEERGLPIVGDDIKSQVGATIVHRVLANLFRERGVRLDRTYQLNFGGNTDFQNMLERERLESKKISKTQAVTSQLDMPLAAERHPCRPERPRAVAHRPQVGLYPHGGHDLRRRAAERRAEARGLGFAELRRHRHRRGALRQARARPRHRRRADRARRATS